MSAGARWVVGFLRHAEAEPGDGEDFPRRLTDKGRRQAARVARFFADHLPAPGLIVSSPVTRALQTAEVLAERSGTRLVIADWLACGMSPAACFAGLREFANEAGPVVLVGHEPDFSSALAAFVGAGDGGAFRLRKATLAWVEADRLEPGGGRLQFLVPPRLMG